MTNPHSGVDRESCSISSTPKIGIDLMGSETSSEEIVQAVFQAHDVFYGVSYKESDTSFLPSFILLATEAEIKKIQHRFVYELKRHPKISFHTFPDVVFMQDSPLQALKKKTSTLLGGVIAIEKKEIDAFITCGNTGALITSCHHFLPLLPNVSKPALLTRMPRIGGSTVILDVGGSTKCTSDNLVNYASIGASFHEVMFQTRKPKVALLNVGVEPDKGTEVLKEAWQKLTELKQDKFSFIGNIEGNTFFFEDIDIVVTNGFAGNIFVKTAEGVSKFVLKVVEQEMKKQQQKQQQEVKFSLLDLLHHASYEEYFAGLVAGVSGIVIKCHGSSSRQAVFNAILGSVNYIQHDLIAKMASRLL